MRLLAAFHLYWKKIYIYSDENISILLFADDMVLIAKNETDLQYMLNAMNEWMNKWRLNVNINKSNIMHFRPK